MADEATLLTRATIPVPFTVADGTGIEKGAALKLTDPRTAIAVSADNDPVAGFAYAEKIASDGITQVATIVGPGDVVKVKASGAITAGQPCKFTLPANQVRAVTDFSGANIVGDALETAADGDTFAMRVHVRNNVSMNSAT